MKKLLTMMLPLAFACSMASAQTITGDAARGAGKTAMCAGCHGIVGYQASFPEIHKVPMIAGQSASYIVSALGAYQSGTRRHPTMRAIATSLSEQDMADLAAYYSQLGRKEGDTHPANSTHAPAAPAGAISCTACHGADFRSPRDATVPKLAGQHADYLMAALKAYRTQANPVVGRTHGVMSAQARNLSNADIRKLAAYIGTLPGELDTAPALPIHSLR